MQTLNAAQKTKKTAAGRIPVDWEAVKLGELLEVRDERHPNNGQLPLCSLTIEKGLIYKPDRYIREFLVKSKDKAYKKIYFKDLVFNPMNLRWGAITVSRLKEVVIASPVYQVLKIIDQDRANIDFLEYIFKTKYFMNIVNTFAEGTLIERTGVNIGNFLKFPMALPPLNEQKKITAILSCADEVINKTQAVIDQTQRLKKALMQDVFTRGLPGRHKKFKKTKIGEIPAEWEIVKLKELLREPIRNGYSPNCPEDSNGHWMLGLDAVTFEGFNPKGVKPAPVDDKKIYDFVLQSGDILVSRSNTKERVGLAGVYIGDPDSCSYSDLLMRVRVDVKRILPFWLENVLLSGYGRMYFEKVARGTSETMVKIDRKLLEDFLCPLPDTKEQKTALTLLQDVQQTINHNNSLINQLSEARSALMQVLLTGEVRVK